MGSQPLSRQPIFQQLVWDSPCLFEQLLSLHDVLAGNKSDFIKQSTLHSVINNVLDHCVLSIEIEHIPIEEAGPGQDVGIKVTERVHEGDMVFRES